MIKNSLRARPHWLGALLALATVLLSLTGCYEPVVTITPDPTATKAPATPTAISVAAPNSPVPVSTTIAPQTNVAASPTPPANNFSEVDSYIRELMVRYDIPGAALGLVKDGQVILIRGYGVRNINTGATVTENTQFPIGSLTKSFTALAIMQLVNQGKLDLDTPAVKYLPELKLADPQATQKVTLRQLLSHTSGLPRSDEGLFQFKDRVKVLSSIEKIKLTAKPGETWQYSNQGYVILGAVIEHVSGQSWENYVRQNILAPLKMSSATLDLTSLKQTSDYAFPHALVTYINQVRVANFIDPKGVASACGINASASDMAEYLRFQLGDGSLPDQKRLTSIDGFNQMHTAQIKLPDYFGYQNRGYAMGWYTGEYRGHKILAHDGTVGDFYANALLAPEAKAGVILLTNMSYNAATEVFSQAVSQEMMDHLLGLNSDPNLAEKLNKQADGDLALRQADLEAARAYSIDPANFSSFLGLYDNGISFPHTIVNVTSRQDKLYMEIKSNSFSQIYELVAYKPNSFIATNLGMFRNLFEFKPERNGAMAIYHEGFPFATKIN